MGSNASKPLIGLSTYRQRSQTGVWDMDASFLPADYFDAVNRAGGIAVLIPPQPIDDAAAGEILDALDGLVICGGRDVDPARYGQQPHQETDKPDTARDELEFALYTAALERKVPFLGICRGQQVLNVKQGGTLIQHLPDVVGSNKYQLGGGNFTTTEISVEPGSLLSAAIGGAATVNGALYHHQAIENVGAGLKVVARSEDGIVEAIELENYPFGLAVQWHPEHTPEDNRIFDALISAAKTFRSTR